MQPHERVSGMAAIKPSHALRERDFHHGRVEGQGGGGASKLQARMGDASKHH